MSDPAADPELQAKAVETLRRLREAYPVPDETSGRLDPVDELVSTILSQNTTDTNRDRAFEALTQRYDDWHAVADAPADEVIQTISVAGLANQKGPRIQRAIGAVRSETGGELSLDFLSHMEPERAREWLMDIKGVGIKTASIVLLFALDMPALPVDTHVHRVGQRIGLIPSNMSAARAHHHLEAIVSEDRYLDFHIALIQHGRAACRAPTPRCDNCNLPDLCDWYAEHRAD